MKKNVQILDCTLRDGGRIINCNFENSTIRNITNELTDAGIDIVEVGFLRSRELVDYIGNSTFFTDVSQITQFIPLNNNRTLYVAFIDYNMYDFDELQECDNKSITGILSSKKDISYLFKQSILWGIQTKNYLI